MEQETEVFDEPCKNCGFLTFELIDGHYYCTECNEQFENIAKTEYDEFAHENILISKRGVKQKDPNKSLNKEREAISNKKTSYEEYNYILHGLVNEILQIEDIPNFKATVLQLWIHYLKKYEIAFFQNENLNHLPKLNGVFRRRDAEILYNKKPKVHKKKKSYYKKKKHTEAEIVGDTKEARKIRRKLVKKSVKAIAKKQMETASQGSNTSSMSVLSNLTLEDVTTAQKGIELAVETSTAGKQAKQTAIQRARKYGRKMEFDDNGEPIINSNDLCFHNNAQILSGHTLIGILYSALNICGSKIQLGDLLRLCCEGHISFYNFRKFLPESLQESKLSLEQFHSLTYPCFVTHTKKLAQFFECFPDIQQSIRLPNLMMLARRYVADLNLPSSVADYAERLIELLPSTLTYFNINIVPNYEGRVMGYVLFVLKYIFGIDGYREKEISESARKINAKLETLNFDGPHQKLFVYEDWRESIEYRDVMLCNYYFPTLRRKDGFKADKPYMSYLSMINAAKPMTFLIKYDDVKYNGMETHICEKKESLKDILAKAQELHENDVDPRDRLHFDWSFTPHKDAFDTILKDEEIKATINKRLVVDYTDTNCNYYLEPDKLVRLLNEHGVRVTTKKCTFPKTFCFKPAVQVISTKNKASKANFDVTVDEKTWKKNFKKQTIENVQLAEAAQIKFHHNQMTDVLQKRFEIQKLINAKNIIEEEQETADEIVAAAQDDKGAELEEEEEDDEREQLEFVVPDFNHWYAKFCVQEYQSQNYRSDLKCLPKSFTWLLNTASNILHQPMEKIYHHVMVIESQMIDKWMPLELTDYNLVSVKGNSRSITGPYRYL